MKQLKNHFLLLSLVSLIGLSSLCANQSNTIEVFYNKTWEAAWSPCKTPYYKGNDICFPCDDIILARLEIFSYWFSPSPFDNRFHDTMLDLEMMVEEKNIEIHELKANAKTRRKKVLIFTISGVASGFILGAIVFK